MRKFLSLFNPRLNPFALFIYALVLVFTTYNTWGHSAWSWLSANASNFQNIWAEYLLVVFLLVAVWGMFLRAAHGAMRWYGMAILVAVISLIVYLPFKWGWLNAGNQDLVINFGQLALAAALGFASSFSRFWFTFFRQRAVDTVEGDTIGIEDEEHA
jgi:hypothetical protein